MGFRAALEREREDIKRHVGTINQSLQDIPYQPGTYIRLEPTATTDADVRDFRAQLLACTEDTVTGSGDNQYSEAKFLQVKEIVSRLQGREGRTEQDRRWTAKVTDVRNWFTFAASERVASDDSEQEHYSDSWRKIGWAEGEAGLHDPGREPRLPIRFGDRTDPLEDVPVRGHR